MLVLIVALSVSASPQDTRAKWWPVLNAAAKHYKLDPMLLDSVIQVESGWREDAQSEAGAIGLAQLMPETARELGVRNPWDGGQNIWGAALYLKRLNDRYCNWPMVLAAYNAGPTRVDECHCVPNIPETKAYVQKVFRHWDSVEEFAFSSCRN